MIHYCEEACTRCLANEQDTKRKVPPAAVVTLQLPPAEAQRLLSPPAATLRCIFVLSKRQVAGSLLMCVCACCALICAGQVSGNACRARCPWRNPEAHSLLVCACNVVLSSHWTVEWQHAQGALSTEDVEA